jgi:hypothetical protein
MTLFIVVHLHIDNMFVFTFELLDLGEAICMVSYLYIYIDIERKAADIW